MNTTPVLVMVFSVWRAYGDLPFLIGLIDSSVCMLKTFFKDVRSLFVSNVQTPTQVGTQQIEVLIESKGKVAVDTYDNKTCYKYIGAYICIRLVVFVCTGVPFLLF